MQPDRRAVTVRAISFAAQNQRGTTFQNETKQTAVGGITK